MPNSGPDGVNRCGILRGKKCEQKRYEEEKNSQLNIDIKAAEVKAAITDIATGSNSTIYVVIGVIVIALIGFILWRKFKK